MVDVSHTNPFTGETFGGAFHRGPPVADGGEPHAIESTDPPADADDALVDAGGSRTEAASADAPDGGETMAEIDHTPPNADVNEVWSRGAHAPGVRDE